MPTLHIDHLSNLAAREERGVVRGMTRLVRVEFTQAEIATHRNPNVLMLALAVLDDAGLTAMSVLGVGRDPQKDPEQRYAPLVLTKRLPKLSTQDDNCWVDVTLEYEHLIDGPNQVLRDPPILFSTVYGKGRTSIREKTTNFFYPYGNQTPENLGGPGRVQILVAHQYGPNESGIPASAYSKEYPRVVFQGGEIKLPYPESTYTITGLVSTRKPAKLTRQIVTCLNRIEWQGGPPRSWICSAGEWEINNPAYGGDLAEPVYRMSFEFQHNSDGWDPEVVFLDERYGRPPADVQKAINFDRDDEHGVLRMASIPVLTEGGNLEFKDIPAGLWKVPALVDKDFDAFFGVLFDGMAPGE